MGAELFHPLKQGLKGGEMEVPVNIRLLRPELCTLFNLVLSMLADRMAIIIGFSLSIGSHSVELPILSEQSSLY